MLRRTWKVIDGRLLYCYRWNLQQQILIGTAFARRFNIPLLFGESFYNSKQFNLACAGATFDMWESFYWARDMIAALKATGGCVLVCKHLDGGELPSWQSCGRIFIIHADPTVEEMNARWTAEQQVPHLAATTGQPRLSNPATVQDDITNFLLEAAKAEEAAALEYIAKADERAAYERQMAIYAQAHHDRIMKEYGL